MSAAEEAVAEAARGKLKIEEFMKILEEIKNWGTEIILAAFAFFAAYSAFAIAKLPLWLTERFGEVSPEQIIFFASNPLSGTDPAVKKSFIKALIEEPVLIAAIIVLPGIITYIFLRIFRLHRTNEDIAAQVRQESRLKPALMALLAIAFFCEATYPVINKGMQPVKFYNANPPQGKWADPQFLIAHAGGGIGGRPYTNSMESMNEAIKNGFTMIELDLDMTSDGKIAAVHDWDYFRGITGNEKNGKPMSLEEFKSQKIYGKYSPMDAEQVKLFFETNKKAVLITDKIKDFPEIKKNFPFTDRLITEVFSYSDYDKAIKEGIIYPALNLNAIGKVEPEKILKKNIRMATVSDVFLEKYPAEIELLHKRGVAVMLYAPTKVINRPEYLKSLLGKKISMAYVDFCSPKNTECRR